MSVVIVIEIRIHTSTIVVIPLLNPNAKFVVVHDMDCIVCQMSTASPYICVYNVN